MHINHESLFTLTDDYKKVANKTNENHFVRLSPTDVNFYHNSTISTFKTHLTCANELAFLLPLHGIFQTAIINGFILILFAQQGLKKLHCRQIIEYALITFPEQLVFFLLPQTQNVLIKNWRKFRPSGCNHNQFMPVEFNLLPVPTGRPLVCALA